MKSLLLLSCSLLLTTAAYSQTKRIAHGSHSGRPGALGYDGPDNFGIINRVPREIYRTDTAHSRRDTTPVPPPKTARQPVRKPAPAPARQEQYPDGVPPRYPLRRGQQ